MPPVLIQPIAAGDVADTLAEVAQAQPSNGVLEVAGPQQFRLDELIKDTLSTLDDPPRSSPSRTRATSTPRSASPRCLPGYDARTTRTHLRDWQGSSATGG